MRTRVVQPSNLPNQSLDFRRRLLAWYRQNGRALPWRETRDPYAILVSEFMLQQTQVATVIPYYIRWLLRFPDFAALARADESAVLHAWQGLGYYARARNLHATAKVVTAKFGSIFPTSVAEMRELPGLGRYTANAVTTFAFDRSVPVVEANIARLLARLTNLQLPIDSAAGAEKIWSLAASLLPARQAGRFNSALMDLGAMICIARQPKCEICPVRGWCVAPNPAALPIKRPRAALKHITEEHAFIFGSGRILLEQARTRWRGMWMLPRLTSSPAREQPIHRSEFPFTNHRVTLAVYGRAASSAFAGRWFSQAELASIPIPTPHRRAITHLLDPSSTSAELPRKIQKCAA